MSKYGKMSQQDFDSILEEFVKGTPAGALLQVPGAYEVFSEHFNNDVLEEWERRQPEKEETTEGPQVFLVITPDIEESLKAFPDAITLHQVQGSKSAALGVPRKDKASLDDLCKAVGGSIEYVSWPLPSAWAFYCNDDYRELGLAQSRIQPREVVNTGVLENVFLGSMTVVKSEANGDDSLMSVAEARELLQKHFVELAALSDEELTKVQRYSHVEVIALGGPSEQN